jgi:hypothetical protein
VPRIEDLLDNLLGTIYFSSLDLTSSYHQMRLPASDLPETAFNTHSGKLEWRANRLFSPCLNKCVCIYLDATLVFS